MISEFKRLALELELFSARRRADEYRPFSPAWDAAVAEVEDLERALWRIEEEMRESTRQAIGAVGHEPARS
jgi:hypothetical protein